MKLHCDDCGNTGRFSAIEEVLRTIRMDGDGENPEWENEEVQDVRMYECDNCHGDNITDLETGEKLENEDTGEEQDAPRCDKTTGYRMEGA